MVLPSVAFAADVKTVHIEGDLTYVKGASVENATLTVKDSAGKVMYSGEINVNSDLKYESDVEVAGDFAGCTVSVKQGDADITNSVDVATYSQSVNYSFTLNDENANQSLDADEVLKAATEVANGEVLGKNMSGSAIVALQTQAKVPIEDMQKRLNEFSGGQKTRVSLA